MFKTRLFTQNFKNIRLSMYSMMSLLAVVLIVVAVGATAISFPKAFSNNPVLSLPAQVNATVGSEFRVPVSINTDGEEVVGIDSVINFDPTKLELVSVTPVENTTNNFKLLLPIDESKKFDGAGVTNKANQTGIIEFSASSIDYDSQSVLSAVNGSFQFAILTFKPLTSGQTSVSFKMLPNVTTDSNVVKQGSTPVDTLSDNSQIVNLSVLVSSPQSSPTPTATPTSTPIQSPTPTSSSTPASQQDYSVTEIPASQDTYVDSNSASSGHGFEKSIYVDGSPKKITYLLFDLSRISGQLEEAKLSLQTTSANYSGSPDTVQVYLVPENNWDEDMNYYSKPVISSQLVGELKAEKNNTTYDIDLKIPEIQQRFGNEISLAIVPTGNDAFYAYSRESGVYSPKLLLKTSSLNQAKTSIINIYAAGTPDGGVYPDMDLYVKDQRVARFVGVNGDASSRKFQIYSYTYPEVITSKDIKLYFVNDSRTSNGDKNLVVDKISINGTEYQSEADNVYGTGVWTRGTGCTEGNYKTEWLYCNGYLQY